MIRFLSPLVLALVMAASASAVDPALLAFDKLPVRSEWPDPLTMFDGSKVTTWDDWNTKRKPELKQLFQELMYGRYPTVETKPTAKVVYENLNAFGGKGTLREVALTLAPGTPPVYWLIALPKDAKPVPVFIGLSFSGNHGVVTDEGVRIPDGWMYPNRVGVVNNKATAAGRGKETAWPIEAILERGCGLAIAYNGDIIPDNEKIRGGLADLLLPKPAGKPDPAATATVMAWAWGIHRGVDYLLTLPAVDAKRIAVVGHSRLGKAAIVAGAFDDRIAIVVANQAGCGGTAPNRRINPKSEPVARINTAFPHWFNGNFKLFNEATDKLPFDQHALVALCAPRPVLFTNAEDDVWADPPGQLQVLKAAAPVYELAGRKNPAPTEAVAPPNKLLGGVLGYWLRPGKHAMTPADWQAYLDFADKGPRTK